MAFSWKAHSLVALGRIDEAIAIYDDVAARFGAASEPALVERAAMAIFDQARTLKEEHAEARHIVKRSEALLAVLN